MTEPGAAGTWSVKDIIASNTFWHYGQHVPDIQALLAAKGWKDSDAPLNALRLADGTCCLKQHGIEAGKAYQPTGFFSDLRSSGDPLCRPCVRMRPVLGACLIWGSGPLCWMLE